MNQLEQVQRDLKAENEQLKWMLSEIQRRVRYENNNSSDRAFANLNAINDLFDSNDEIVALFAPEEDQD